MNYYSDNDPKVCAWLRRLIAGGLLPHGIVDQRSIEDVKAPGLEGWWQCHFFAGIGGWPRALELAGWPEQREVWTASCPCQPFSTCGKRTGRADRRHLWPILQSLIAYHRPPVIFGEQVASPLGRKWLAGVRADVEALGYAFGASDLPAACVGAPHTRQRLFWVADAGGSERDRRGAGHTQDRVLEHASDGGEGGGMGDARGLGQEAAWVQEREFFAGGNGEAGGVGDAQWQRAGFLSAGPRPEEQAAADVDGAGQGFWSDYDLAWCDHRSEDRGFIPRRIEPGTFPLADGVPGRVVKLRGYGNAIVPQVAAVFVRAFMEAERDIEQNDGSRP